MTKKTALIEPSPKTVKFCSSCGREKIIEGGQWIATSNKKKRWICVYCLFNRTHRISS